MNKRGAEEISAGAVIGLVLGGLMLLILISVAIPYVSDFWSFFFGASFDSQTKSSFENLVTVIDTLEDGESKSIPMRVEEEAAIVSFNRNVKELPNQFICEGEVITDKAIFKPCENSCLCLCKMDGKLIKSCSSDNCLNVDYDTFGWCGYVVLPGFVKESWFNVIVLRAGNNIEVA